MSDINPLIELEPHERSEFLYQKTILLGYRGSHAHGTYIPTTEPDGVDDVDLMGIYIPNDLDHWLGLRQSPETVEKWVRHYDIVIYEFRKFVGLLMKCNPNVLGMLYLKKEHYLILEEEGQALIDHRDLFATKAAYTAFSGYAYSQIKRMTAWNTTDPLQAGRGSQKLYATGFMGAKRKALVEKYGFDVKNAAHAIRLLRMGIEFLKTGHLQVDRSSVDADYLIQIKTGKVGLSEILREADARLPEMAAALKESKLPEAPDFNRVNHLVTKLVANLIRDKVVRNFLDHYPVVKGRDYV